MRNTYYLLSFILLLFLSACGEDQSVDQPIDPFSFQDQTGETFTMDDLLGKVWIANFIFTNCDTVCPQMTYEMAALQSKFAKENIDVEFVSFTVDPNMDSPEVLQKYMQNFTDDESNWHMLTGYAQEEIETFAREQFQTIVQKPETSNQVIHGVNFYLVDSNGVVVNEYNYIDEFYDVEMMEDVKSIE